MRIYTREQAFEVALRGAQKMAGQNYTYEQIDPENDEQYIVTGPKGQIYRVTIADGGYCHCSCPFCDYGYNNPTCKHIEWLRDILEWIRYADVNRLIAQTVRQIRLEEESWKDEEDGVYSISTEEARHKYPLLFRSASVWIQTDGNGDPIEPEKHWLNW